MSGKPWQSVLAPYEDEINILRRRRPPYSYAHIAQILREKHQLSVCRETIFRFVKARSRNRKVYALYGTPLPKKQPAVPEAKPQVVSPKPVTQASPMRTPKTESRFEVPFSQHYNLHLLSQEEAAALSKRLEEEERNRK